MRDALWVAAPACAAFVYAVAALFFKRAYAAGASTRAVFHRSNLIAMLVFLPLFFIDAAPLPPAQWWQPALVAALIYAGTLATFSAIRRSDVSLVTPLLGTKVVLVAALYAAIGSRALDGGLWIAAVLATAGVLVIGRAERNPAAASGAAVALCLGSSVVFSLADVLIGQWARSAGRGAFLAAIAQCIGAISIIALATGKRPPRLANEASRWTTRGAILLAAQQIALGLSLAFLADPATVNILYITRGIWSIALVCAFGAWFANRERRDAGPRVMLERLAGTLLISASVIIAIARKE